VYNKRVAVVDFDVHHGNGTEAILKERYSKELGSTVMFASIHLYEAFEDSSLDFFPGTGGGDAAAAGIINIPIQPLWARHRWRCCSHGDQKQPDKVASAGSSSKESEAALKAVGGPTKSGGTIRSGRGGWRDGISKRLLPALRSFRPEIILVSAGFDGASGDEGNTQDEISGRCP
jgi:acetoin utilization deacetylase AcuC-like enzyme